MGHNVGGFYIMTHFFSPFSTPELTILKVWQHKCHNKFIGKEISHARNFI